MGWAVLSVLAAACGSADSPVGAVPASRRWMDYTQSLVREIEPPPTTAARLYAYVATAYGDVRERASEAQANQAAGEMLDRLLPQFADRTAVVEGKRAPLTGEARAVVDRLIDRIEHDGFANTASPQPQPRGEGFWAADFKPATPAAGTWRRWIVGDARFEVPPPTPYGSDAYATELQAVRDAVLRRDARWSTAVNFWGGVPGTETPAGIWLNRLWTEAGPELRRNDKDYARVQSILARTLADAFIETWNVKYTYWTARPNMIDGSLDLSMPNPPFPGYVSGHSTISSAAATVLGALLPGKADLFMKNAAEARDSRLYAGIHFPSDNEQGFALGIKVGEAVIDRLELDPVSAARR